MNGNLSEAARHLKRAEAEAQETRYEAALDRARVGLAAMQLQSGSVISAWDLAVTGLKHFWATPLPLERGESFCDLLDIAAEENRQWHLLSAVLMEALSLLELQSDRLAEAQVLVRLAGRLLMLHRSAEAKSYWTKALADFQSAPQTAATRNQALTVRINLAKSQATAQDYSSSVSQLEQLRPQLRDLPEDLSLIEFYTTLGEGYRKLGNAPRAEGADLEAIRVFRQGLASLNHGRDRLTWYRRISSAYRSLVQFRINESQSADALLIWQEYRRAGIAFVYERDRCPLRFETGDTYIDLDDLPSDTPAGITNLHIWCTTPPMDTHGHGHTPDGHLRRGFAALVDLFPLLETAIQIPDGFTPVAGPESRPHGVEICDVDPGRDKCSHFGYVNCHYANLLAVKE